VTTGDRGREVAPVRLDAASVEAVARRVAELINAPREHHHPGRLLTAAEVANWWSVARDWVYAHAEELGALRIGAGSRPRLRFEPKTVAERIGALGARAARRPERRARKPRRRSRVGSAQLLPIHAEAELSSPTRTSNRPGGAATPPAVAPKSEPSAR
jgi:hypothetical protein